MRDGEGREIDFRNTVILMTSNLGSDHLMQLLDEQPEATKRPARTAAPDIA
jgi:type VI secretion system protein VasG